MKNENGHNELDKFLRESFEGHSVEPDAELWQGIEQRFAPKVVPMQKYSRLKLAFYGSAVVIAGLIFMLVFFRNETPKQNDDIKNELVEKHTEMESTPSKEKEAFIAEKFVTPKTAADKAVHSETEKRVKQIVSTQQIQNIPENIANLSENETDIFLSEIKSIEIEDFDFSRHPEKEELQNFVPEKKSETVKTSKPANKNNKSTHTSKQSKSKPISAKKYYAQQSKGKNKPGIFSDRFDLKAIVTPTFSSNTLNNVQNVAVDFDQKYFKEIENPRFVINFGVELSYRINQHWNIYSGVKISNYSFGNQADKSHYEILSTNQVNIPSSAGNLLVNGDRIGELPTQYKFKTQVKLLYFDIPLVARYHFKPDFYFDAGLKYSYLLTDNTKGRIADNDTKIKYYKISGLQKSNFGMILGTGFEHTTKSGIRFELGPEFCLNFNNLNPKSNVISKPLSIGFRAGLFFGRYD